MAGLPKISALRIERFRNTVWEYYRKARRRLPWRQTTNPYHILVSEVMLQQTQVERVAEKYEAFINAFPDFPSLRRAPLHRVLSIWQGLGYNRRAIALKRIAEEVMRRYRGTVPSSVEELIALPGIGKATASAIVAFAYNQPSVFVETNIRRVIGHFFFPRREHVTEQELLAVVEKTLDRSDPRQWYYALMDYGAMLKRTHPNRVNVHRRRQPRFEGSRRQLRGVVLRTVLHQAGLTESALIEHIGKEPRQVREVLRQLKNEGFLKKRGGIYTIS